MLRLSTVLKLDPFLLALITTVTLATVLPCSGTFADVMGWITNAGIVLLFFLHGARLSRRAILDGIGAWKIHALAMGTTYIVFPIIGLLIRAAGHGWLNPAIGDGLVFLCLMPSTVQSSIAFTSIARGNVPAAVCSASASNVAGIFIAPVLVGLTLMTNGRGGFSLDAVLTIMAQLLVPFIAGHLSRPLTAGFVTRHKSLLGRVDRSTILLVVYTAFSAAVIEGLWQRYSLADLGWAFVLNGAILALVLIFTTVMARRIGLSKPDEIAAVFCGSKKSIASGVPMASVLFPKVLLGPMVLPLMLFHQMQLMVCAVMAQRYAERKAD